VTDADQRLALEFYNEYRPDIVSVFWLKYYPKLPIIDLAMEKGILKAEDLEDIEEGRNEASYLFGGNAPEFKKWLGYNFLFGWLNFLPRRFVDGLVKNPPRVDWFAWESFFFAASLPRLLSTIFRRPDFRGRDHIRRMVGQVFYIARLVARDWRRERTSVQAPQATNGFARPEPRPWPVPAADGPDTAHPDRVVVGRRSGGKITASR